MVDLNELARKKALFIDNAATASQNVTLIDDEVTREAIELNVIAPLIVEISERDTRIAALEAKLAEVREKAKQAAAMYEAGYSVNPLKLATSIISALEATPPATHANSASVEATPPASKGPWPVYYANTTAPGRFAPPAPKVTEWRRKDDPGLIEALISKSHASYCRSKGRDPEKYISRYSAALEVVREARGILAYVDTTAKDCPPVPPFDKPSEATPPAPKVTEEMVAAAVREGVRNNMTGSWQSYARVVAAALTAAQEGGQ